MSRPTKLTSEIAQAALEAIQLGAGRRDAADRIGVNVTTLERWLRGRTEPYVSFANSVKKAEIEAKLSAIGTIHRTWLGGQVLSRKTIIRPDGTRIVEETFTEANWTAAAWYLERRFPREWGKVERIELSIKERAEALADELGMSVEAVLAEAQRIAFNATADRRGLPNGR